MTDDEQGLERAEQLEAALSRELASRADFHRNWLEAQLAELTADADKVQRDLEEAAARREKQHHELKNSNPEEYRDSEGFKHNQSNDAWLAVAGFFGATTFLLVGTLEFFPRHTELSFVGLADFILALFGFLALTPLWSPAPKPPALMPMQPSLPRIEQETLSLPAGTWRDRLELAQSKLTKLTRGDQSPESSGYAQQVLAQARADLRRFIADGRVYLSNIESDHLGWRGAPWPAFIGTFRLVGLPAIPCALIPLGVVYGQIGLLHGAIALAGGLRGFLPSLESLVRRATRDRLNMSRNGRGHYCWCCERMRPNEQFSGGGHRRHLCRECARLEPGELAFRQAARNIDRCFHWGGGVKRKSRKTLEQFLAHADERIRRYAEGRVREMQFDSTQGEPDSNPDLGVYPISEPADWDDPSAPDLSEVDDCDIPF